MIDIHRGALVVAGMGLSVGCGVGVAAPSHADAVAVIVKSGSFRISQDRQTIDGGTIQLDDGASGVFGLEGEWHQASGLAIGVEYPQYENDLGISSAARTGTMETSVPLLNIEKYFHPNTESKH